jgi:UPF0716 protein FxsA
MRFAIAWLLALFIIVPLVELALLLEVGRRLGTVPTLGIIILTGVVGAALARQQGLGVIRRIRREVSEGRVPGSAIVDGAMILVAGALLMTPGLLTDVFGFLCLIPATRRLIRQAAWRRLERMAGIVRTERYDRH